MSIRVRIVVVVGALLIAAASGAQQPSTSKKAVRPSPADNGPTLTDATIKEMMKAGRSAEAARLLEEQARRNPGDRAIKARVAAVYESQGDLTAAKAAAQQAASGDTPSPGGLAVLGRIAAREGDWANAVVHWRSVVNAKPTDAAAHLDYANALEHIGDVGGADTEYATYRSLIGLAPLPQATTKK